MAESLTVESICEHLGEISERAINYPLWFEGQKVAGVRIRLSSRGGPRVVLYGATRTGQTVKPPAS